MNIYFVGDVQLPGTGAWAATLDPGVLTTITDIPAWILINDGGFRELFGFAGPLDAPAFADGSPAAVTGYHIIEHEMAHYLARFQGRSFPLTGSQYDAREHDITVGTPPPRNNVLNSNAGQSTYPLVVPGSVLQMPSELQEIWDRVNAGLWNLP